MWTHNIDAIFVSLILTGTVNLSQIKYRSFQMIAIISVPRFVIYVVVENVSATIQ
jgi:hypothetical protein